MAKKILIVEDNRDISRLLSDYLKEHGYETICAYDGKDATVKIKEQDYVLILMDLMLPYKGGDRLIQELRTYSKVPVIVLSAKSMMETRLEVLRLGADDYILQPFDLDEVLVRIEVVLRRVEGDLSGTEGVDTKEQILRCGDLVLYVDEHRVMYRDKQIMLTAKELQVLQELLAYPNKTFTKANLYEAVWNDTYYYEDNTINVHVSNLRNKLKRATGHDYIETVWGIGYRLKEE